VSDAPILASALRQRLENDPWAHAPSASNFSSWVAAIAESVCNSDHTWSTSDAVATAHAVAHRLTS